MSDPSRGEPAMVMGGEMAARDAAALLLGLAGLLDKRRLNTEAVHPDLHEAMITRLRAVGTELAQTHEHLDLVEHGSAPAEGTAWASQLVALLGNSEPPPPERASEGATGDVNESRDRVTEQLDETGHESFPASDPPSR